MKAFITIWDRKGKNGLEFNHIENSWSSQEKPKAHTKDQSSNWNNSKWKNTPGYLDNNDVVYTRKEAIRFLVRGEK